MGWGPARVQCCKNSVVSPPHASSLRQAAESRAYRGPRSAGVAEHLAVGALNAAAVTPPQLRPDHCRQRRLRRRRGTFFIYLYKPSSILLGLAVDTEAGKERELHASRDKSQAVRVVDERVVGHQEAIALGRRGDEGLITVGLKKARDAYAVQAVALAKVAWQDKYGRDGC